MVATRSMDMMKNSPFDVSSSYLLIEASGDSEADWNPYTKGEHADDDAQSCIYDSSEICNASELNGYDESWNIDDDVEDEKKDDVIHHGTSYCDDDEMQQHQKSCVSDDSGQEFVDEMEKNRLFWEACLAS